MAQIVSRENGYVFVADCSEFIFREVPKFRADFDRPEFLIDVFDESVEVEKIHVAVPRGAYDKITEEATELMVVAAIGLFEIACEEGREVPPGVAETVEMLKVCTGPIPITDKADWVIEQLEGEEIAKIWGNRYCRWIMKGAYREAVASFFGPNQWGGFARNLEDLEMEDPYACDPPEMSVEGFPGW